MAGPWSAIPNVTGTYHLSTSSLPSALHAVPALHPNHLPTPTRQLATSRENTSKPKRKRNGRAGRCIHAVGSWARASLRAEAESSVFLGRALRSRRSGFVRLKAEGRDSASCLPDCLSACLPVCLSACWGGVHSLGSALDGIGVDRAWCRSMRGWWAWGVLSSYRYEALRLMFLCCCC
ncbi:predicted protein [Plenodomus lingam JN3]|uniref:Predicted protein n=1 Tax=Leptosphaeria maculans (strain JN3 / isolate v23.1.3 / race Av1-4-5-6-7-8) TaxID=985895 RepID=E4ZNA4_LEPMJ|nr:predicted protein [Plenodomus lingam JN3]CBX92963.1 predicted protein [Plenodomus lingam JN3]